MTRQAFEHIAHELRPRLKDIGRRFFGDEDRAEDIAQETLMRLWLLRDRIAPQADIEPLAVRMAKNLCVSEWRKQQVRQGQVVRVEIVLRHAISLLKPAEQRLFRMRHEAEMDISQIASATGIGERSVSAMLSTAKRKLQEILTRKGGLQ